MAHVVTACFKRVKSGGTAQANSVCGWLAARKEIDCNVITERDRQDGLRHGIRRCSDVIERGVFRYCTVKSCEDGNGPLRPAQSASG